MDTSTTKINIFIVNNKKQIFVITKIALCKYECKDVKYAWALN